MSRENWNLYLYQLQFYVNNARALTYEPLYNKQVSFTRKVWLTDHTKSTVKLEEPQEQIMIIIYAHKLRLLKETG